jgi:hypothetical protein
MRTIWVGLAVAGVLAGCGASDPESVSAPCSDGSASHDFGTTDAATLAQVVAYASGPDCAPDGVQVAGEGPGVVGYAAFEVPISFDGSVGTVTCGPCNTLRMPTPTFTEVRFDLP